MAHGCMHSKDFHSILERDRNDLVVTIETDFFQETVSTAEKFSRFCNIEGKICPRRDVYDFFSNLIMVLYLLHLGERIVSFVDAKMTFLAEAHAEYGVVICDHSDILFSNGNQSDFALY
jgi:hypothetical protein